jgi:hypothetical protein
MLGDTYLALGKVSRFQDDGFTAFDLELVPAE